MKLTVFFTYLMVFVFVLGCGGKVTVYEDAKEFESSSEPRLQQPYRCGNWTRDEAFSKLMIGGDSIDMANGSNVSSDLMITVSAGEKQALAKRTVHGWEILSLPANVYQAQKLCTLPDSTTYLAIMNTDGEPQLLKGDGINWSTELMPVQLAQIVNVWVANGAVLLTGLTKTGSTVVMSNESGAWQVETLPDLQAPYFLYRFWSVRGDYFAFGFFDFEKGAQQHALLLRRHAEESSWQKVDLPSDVYLIGEMFGYSADSLYVAGQNEAKSAILYKAVNDLSSWEALASDVNLFAFTNVWQHANGALIVAGQSESKGSSHGSYVELSGQDFYEDSAMEQSIDDSAGLPSETWYDESTKLLYLLTSRDLYYRHCP